MKTSAITSVTETPMIYARAPGKIILSGEHSVVYGADALAVAVQEYTTVNFSPVSQSKAINTLFSGISTGVTYPINALSKLKHRLDDRFERFTRGDLPAQNILNHPNDLAMYALMSLLHHLPSRKTLQHFAPHSGVLRSESSIPVGAGMGSSASAIAATLVLYEGILDKPLTTEQRFDMVRFCERLQHGRGSAIDAATVTYGGVIRVREQKPTRAHIELDHHWYWLHTGTPATSTGECVQYVRRHHASDNALWNDFIAVTRAFMHALEKGENPSEHIKANQQLLAHIGVVPDKAQQLIKNIERLGGVAKISGAGAVSGDKSGLVLMYLPDANIHRAIDSLNNSSGHYIKSWGKLAVDEQGAMRISSAY